MNILPKLEREFSMTDRFPAQWNPAYPFADPAYIAEIKKQDEFDAPGALMAMEPYQSGGGSVIPSPWGSNRSVDAGVAEADTVEKYLAGYGLQFSQLLNPNKSASTAEEVEYCIKDLVVNPGNQLSLQRHRGREEYWVVKEGLLTVICDGSRVEVKAGEAIFIPKGSVHCMNNNTDAPVHVEELQFGICREKDNVRLLDATRDEAGAPKPRPTYPIKTENEYKSAVLFAQLASEIAQKNGLSQDARMVQFAVMQPA